jgi:hypothetical protein
MKNERSIADPPFRLKQESARSKKRAAKPIRWSGVLQAWPTGQGDYFLTGRDTFLIKDRIYAAGGRWDGGAKKWFVSREQAKKLGAAVLVRVLRAPVCCEKATDTMEVLATEQEVVDGRMRVPTCTRCDLPLQWSAPIVDIMDLNDLPDLPPVASKPPWEE